MCIVCLVLLNVHDTSFHSDLAHSSVRTRKSAPPAPLETRPLYTHLSPTSPSFGIQTTSFSWVSLLCRSRFYDSVFTRTVRTSYRSGRTDHWPLSIHPFPICTQHSELLRNCGVGFTSLLVITLSEFKIFWTKPNKLSCPIWTRSHPSVYDSSSDKINSPTLSTPTTSGPTSTSSSV